MSNVILLRAPTGDALDAYEDRINGLGYTSVSVPVLETVVTNLDRLKRVIERGPAEQGLTGVIVTSGRSCEAWKRALGELLEDAPKISSSLAADWTTVPFYVVGPSTASAVADIGAVYGSPLAPRIIRGGQETGTSERLAHYILNDISGSDSQARMLYLTGDKNRDTLPTILRDGGVELDALQVYGTQGASAFPTDLKNAIDRMPSKRPWWIVYFAPSAAEFVTPFLRDIFDLPSPAEALRDTVKIAAIGPTTAQFLRDKLDLRVDVVPPKPTPEDLSNAIASHDRDSR
ncbi:hypothetical protein PLICRDRAFT_119223 [Plicaturopsis crispa FD-325 SS-3]|uniref:Tetrapyrrole biosynthesis uroporphyrinogen III synthase domain-containing protein n=1 Tax=Plicaturopsis crispa FD-325 SS-3 TaxID=944288 RepID=A0A0C9SKG0_PLICR|nr:hypothetical protein PLICRDRAFT_119223 [Plicaturopsis crispa FD-325 SS-3]